MTWLDSIYDLQYYNQPKGIQCYCEELAFPSDLMLHASIAGGGSNYTLKVYVYSPDGLTQYEDATLYFDHYFGKVSASDLHFFNARMKTFAPSMCAHACYILRAVVTTQISGQTHVVFDKYTERYCQSNCCDVAKNISITQTGFQPNVIGLGLEDANNPVLIGGNPDSTPVNTSTPAGAPSVPRSETACGEPVIRLITKFDCADNFTGDYYGKPDVVLSGGSADFTYVRVSTFKGRLVRKPRSIEKEVSYNCKLQRVESTPQFLLEGFEFFPDWKMYEIEHQLHANHIYIDDNVRTRRYDFAGEAAFSQINKCAELFKLEATMQECTQRQIFGCGLDCETDTLNFDGSNVMFAIPGNYNGGAFFSESKQAIAHDVEGLVDYLRTRNGVVSAQEVDISSIDSTLHKVVSVSGKEQLPSALYYDAPVAKNKIFAQKVSDIELLKLQETIVCAKPTTSAWAVEEAICTTPVGGSISMTDLTSDELTITEVGNWVIDNGQTHASIYEGIVTLSIKVDNTVLVQDPELLDEPLYVTDALIGIMSLDGRPANYAVINNGNNSGMPDFSQIIIDVDGNIRYTGELTTATITESNLLLSNLTYNI